MTFIQKLLDKSGLSLLFRPRIDDEQERQQTINWINHCLASIIETVAGDIEKEKQGLFLHAENQTAASLGYIQYLINDKNGNRLELSQFSLVSCNSIKMTENYQKLKSIVKDLGFIIELKEINIDGDGVETYEELDDFLDDFARYFIIQISGW